MKISPHGSRYAKITIVGESPGQVEEVQGQFFVGPSGQMLDALARTAGLTRADMYFTNVAKERPPNNDFAKRYYTMTGEPSAELYTLYRELEDELGGLSTNVIVAVGNEALRALTGKDTISNWRGSIIETPLGKVIPVVHPSAIMRAPEKGKNCYGDLWARSVFDWHKIARESKYPECLLPKPIMITSPTIQQVLTYFRSLHLALENDHDLIVALDIETVNNEIDCIGFSASPDEAICIPFMSMTGTPYWQPSDEAVIWREISWLLANPKIGKVLQNANYDLTYLTRHGCNFVNLAMDTMNAHHVCYPETPKGLDFLCSIYTRYPYYKDQSKVDRWLYNCLDAVVTRTCYDSICKELEDLGMSKFYFDLVNNLVLPYKDVADTGIKINMELKERITQELESKLNSITTHMAELSGKTINLASPTQVKALLYEDLGLAPVIDRKTKKITTDDEAITSLLQKYCKNSKAVEVLSTLRLHRETFKELTTYARACIDPDQRCRTTYIVSGTETGRLSSQKAITDTGANLQNITKGELFEGCGYGIRSFFVPDKGGDVFIEGDLSGADARIVAWVSQDPGLIRIFADGRDIHIQNASIFFGVPYEEIDGRIKDKDATANKWRKIAKTCGHAANYGIGPNTLAKNLSVPVDEAKRLLQTYLNNYIGVGTWHRDIESQLKLTRTLTTPLGRKRTFFGRWGDELFKEAYAYVPQSTVADIIHLGFLSLYQKLKSSGLERQGVRVALNIHDAITINTPRHLFSQSLALMKSCMFIPLTFSHGTEIVPVEFSTGDNWFSLEKIKETAQ